MLAVPYEVNRRDTVYECADGKWLQLGCVHAAFIKTAAALMGLAEVISQPRFRSGLGGETPADEADLREILTAVIARKPLAVWAEAFEAADVTGLVLAIGSDFILFETEGTTMKLELGQSLRQLTTVSSQENAQVN